MDSFLNIRQPQADIDPQFIRRRSTRAFLQKPIEQEKLLALFEAARWAPSSGNEQPWLFLYADEGEELERFRSLLTPANQRWANKAPLLLYLLGRRKWSKSGRDNYTYQFDCGSAFMSLALQAVQSGLSVHPMGGFDREQAYNVLQVNKLDFDIIAAIAVGYYGDADQLPEDLLERENPSSRKEPTEVYQKWKMKGDLNG